MEQKLKGFKISKSDIIKRTKFLTKSAFEDDDIFDDSDRYQIKNEGGHLSNIGWWLMVAGACSILGIAVAMYSDRKKGAK